MSSDPTTKQAFVGDGVTVAFETPFPFTLASDLLVYTISVDDDVLLKEIATHYTVSGGADDIGTVTMLIAPPDQSVLLIVRKGPPDSTRYDYLETTDDDAIVAKHAFDSYDKSALYLTMATALAATSDTQVLVNNAGLIDGEAAFTYNFSTNLLSADHIATQDVFFSPAATPSAPATGAKLYMKDLGTAVSPRFLFQAGNEASILRDAVILVINTTGSTIPAGAAVYVTGASGGSPAVAPAKADNTLTASVFGIMLAPATAGSAGVCQIQGIAGTTATPPGIDTSMFSVGDVLYLSDTVAGGLVTTHPNNPSFAVKIGVVTVSAATLGAIALSISPLLDLSLNNMADVGGNISSPAVNQILTFNGAFWVNAAPSAASAGAGVSFFPDETAIIPAGSGPQTIPLKTLLRTPSTAGETSNSTTVNSGAIGIIAQYRNAVALGGTQIDGGVWNFDIYRSVNATAGVSTVTTNVYRSIAGAGTITLTGSGLTRTATVTGGTPFVSGDANANMTLSSYLETPNGVFQISAFTSTSVVTVVTLSTYTNESAVAYRHSTKLFGLVTADIQDTAATLEILSAVQQPFAVNASDYLGVFFFGTSTAASNKTISVYVGGTIHASNIFTPLVVRHNDLVGLQGGTAAEFFHLTSAEYVGSGTGVFARVSSPVFTTPNIGVATGSVSGSSGSCTGNAATATLASTVTVVDSTDTTCFVAIFDDATGSLPIKTDGGLLYNASTGMLTATGLTGPLTGNVTGNVTGSSGSCTGNAATVTTNANLTGEVTSSGNAAVLDKTAITNRTADATPDSAADYVLTYDASATSLKKVLLSNLPAGSGGNAATITVVDSTDTTCFVAIFDDATGSLPVKTDGALLYNASTGALTSASLVTGAITSSDSSLDIAGLAAATGGSVSLIGGSSTSSGAGGNLVFTGGNAATSGQGGSLNLTGGTSSGTTTGSNISFTAGDGGSTAGAGGSLALTAGNGIATGNGGGIALACGASGSGAGANGGGVTLTGGTCTGTGAVVGGPITLLAGSTTNGAGGAVSITAGNGNTAGGITITAGTAVGAGTLGTIVLSGLTVKGASGSLLSVQTLAATNAALAPPTGAKSAYFECWGGGGGSAGLAAATASQIAIGQAGGGGAYSAAWVATLVAGNFNCTVGAGGTAGTSGAHDGVAGGTTSVIDSGPTTLCSAVGGSAGLTANTLASGITAVAGPAGAAGGLGSSGVGDITTTGGKGQAGLRISGVIGFAGSGGNCPGQGQGGPGAVEAGAGIAAVAGSFGAGAGGAIDSAATARAGAAGIIGLIRIHWYS